MAENERQITVRNLTGESVTVSIPGDGTVEDLKLILRRTFPLAAKFPSFHLFFKGTKLRPQSKISAHSVEQGEFLVLIPFAKKENLSTKQSDQSTTQLDDSDRNSILKFAESAWSDMLQDLTYLRGGSSNERNECLPSGRAGSDDLRVENGMNEVASTSSSFHARRERSSSLDRQSDKLDKILLGMLSSPIQSVFNEQTSKKFAKFLESVNCLSDPRCGSCMLAKTANSPDGSVALNRYGGSPCLCPAWLQTTVKAFCFLNVFSAFLRLQNEKITKSRLEEALEQLGRQGVRLSIEDIEHLSLACPKVVSFTSDRVEVSSSGDPLVIINCLTEQSGQVNDYNRKALQREDASKILGALKRRERSFKANLWEVIDLLMITNGNEKTLSFSLEDVIASVKGLGDSHESGGKRAKRTRAASPDPHLHRTPCHVTEALLPEEMVEHIRKGIGSEGQMVHVEEICSRKAEYMDIPNELSDSIRSALEHMGIRKLYSHQAGSIQASLAGKNVAVATMTSSGKSLCYNLPVLETLLQNSSACALYLFPTKALAQDQLRALSVMTKRFDAILNIGVYDGDTPQDKRNWLRDNARLLITNPDMLHISILPRHRQFTRIFANLRFVVVDEAHTYKGAFGCHTALILRRLRRLCSHVYGSDPAFVFSTATLANPHEHCMELAKLPSLELIENDGSPSAKKLFILWNPVMAALKKIHGSVENVKKADKDAKFRSPSCSPIMDVSRLFAEMIQHGLRCIAFCKTRKLCEIVLSYTRVILQETSPHLVQSLCAYRAGYTAEERRKIESDFFGGKLCGVAATNALELGIDVGHIDVTLHLGFPGSIASLWQQAGRAGRRGKTSLSVYVAFEGPLDQYFMKHPEKLFRSPIECCHVDAQNQQVLEQHLICAAVEHPLCLSYDQKYFGPGLNAAITSLKRRGCISSNTLYDSSDSIWKYIAQEKTPSLSISIRAIETERYKVVDQRRKEVIEEIEESRAFFQVYEGAVYMNQGKTYLVKSLDLSTMTAFCEEADLKYYTKTRDYTDIDVIGGNMAYPGKVSDIQPSKTAARADNCTVTTTWFGFYRIWKGSNRIFDAVDLALPKYSYKSQAVWIPVPQSLKEEVKMKNFDFRAGLHAASHAVLNVVPLRVICNSSDVAPECANPHDTRYFPERILLYESHPGGTGVCLQVRPFFMELLNAALELLQSCHCSGDAGCPNCVQTVACGEYNEVLHKDAAIIIIKGVLVAEESFSPGIF